MKVELDYVYLYDWVLKEFGIDLDAYKEAQMQRRLASIMRRAGSSNFRDYTQKIKFTWLLPFTGSAWRAEGKKPLPLLTWTEAALFSLNYILCLPLYKAYP